MTNKDYLRFLAVLFPCEIISAFWDHGLTSAGVLEAMLFAATFTIVSAIRERSAS